MDHIFIDLRGRDFRGPTLEFVSLRRASLDPGTDVSGGCEYDVGLDLLGSSTEANCIVTLSIQYLGARSKR